jgi:hypothetical protein
MDLLESFVSSRLPSHAVVSAVRDYFEWQIPRRAADFVPCADDDVDLRTYLLYLRTNGADRAAREEQIASLKQFYHWAHTKGVITHSPFDEYDFAHPFLTSVQINARQQTVPNTARSGSSLSISLVFGGSFTFISPVSDACDSWLPLLA